MADAGPEVCSGLAVPWRGAAKEISRRESLFLTLSILSPSLTLLPISQSRHLLIIMTVFLNGILHARDLPLTPEIALFITSGSLTPEFTLGEDIYHPLSIESTDVNFPSGHEALPQENVQNLRQPTLPSQTTHGVMHAEAMAHDQAADVAFGEKNQPSNQGTEAPLPDEVLLRPLPPSKQSMPSPQGSDVDRENAQPAEPGLIELTEGESVLLGYLSHTLGNLAPPPSFEALFDFDEYESSVTASSAGGLCSPETCADASTCASSCYTSDLDEVYGEKQPKQGQYCAFPHTVTPRTHFPSPSHVGNP